MAMGMTEKNNFELIQFHIFTAWLNFKEMPTILKFLTFHGLMAVIALPVSIIPFDNFEVNGVKITFRQFWADGYGAFTIFIGFAFPACAILFLKKHKYARLAYITTWIVGSTLSVLIMPGNRNAIVEYSLIIGVPVLLIASYLYLRDSVRKYFEL